MLGEHGTSRPDGAGGEWAARRAHAWERVGHWVGGNSLSVQTDKTRASLEPHTKASSMWVRHLGVKGRTSEPARERWETPCDRRVERIAGIEMQRGLLESRCRIQKKKCCQT